MVNCDTPVGLKSGPRPILITELPFDDEALVYQTNKKCSSKDFHTISKRETCRDRCLSDDSCNFYEIDNDITVATRCRTLQKCDTLVDSVNSTIYHREIPEIPDTTQIPTTVLKTISTVTTPEGSADNPGGIPARIARSVDYTDDEDIYDIEPV